MTIFDNVFQVASGGLLLTQVLSGATVLLLLAGMAVVLLRSQLSAAGVVQRAVPVTNATMLKLGEQLRESMGVRVSVPVSCSSEIAVPRKDDRNRGVAGANVFGRWLPPLVITDEDGNFEVDRFDEDVFCGVFTEDFKLGTLKHVEAGVKHIQFELAPTIVLRGTLLDEETESPAANEEIGASIRITHEDGTFSSRFLRSDTTASDRTFEISGVVPGHLYTFNVVGR